MATPTQQAERLTRDKEHLHLQWKHDLEPLAQVAIGDTLVVETADNFALFREMNSEDDLVESMSLTQLNPLTGPIYVTGAQPGDTLVVEVVDVTVEDQGHMALIPNVGVLRNHTRTPHTKIWKIRMVTPSSTRTSSSRLTDRGHLRHHAGGRWHLRDSPRTARREPRRYEPHYRGLLLHAGLCPGAMVMVGDVHANQGDSEIAMGIEVDGTVTLRFVDMVRDEKFRTPGSKRPTLGLSSRCSDPGEGNRAICLYAAEFLADRLGISMEDATYPSMRGR